MKNIPLWLKPSPLLRQNMFSSTHKSHSLRIHFQYGYGTVPSFLSPTLSLSFSIPSSNTRLCLALIYEVHLSQTIDEINCTKSGKLWKYPQEPLDWEHKERFGLLSTLTLGLRHGKLREKAKRNSSWCEHNEMKTIRSRLCQTGRVGIYVSVKKIHSMDEVFLQSDLLQQLDRNYKLLDVAEDKIFLPFLLLIKRSMNS